MGGALCQAFLLARGHRTAGTKHSLQLLMCSIICIVFRKSIIRILFNA